jgi:hypothetical protein
MSVAYFQAPGAFEPRAEQRLRIVVVHSGGELLIDGRIRHTRPGEDGDLVLGVQFKKLDDAIEGRRTRAALTEILGQLQRDEIRRGRTAEAA